MVDPLVSVIMPCYKAGQFIGQALESVRQQTYRRWEVMAVDDAGPEDGTRAAVEAFAKRHPPNRVEFIRHELNRGAGTARNLAIRQSRGKYLALLDPDDFWMPKHLQDAVDALEEDPGAAMCSSPSILCYNDAGVPEGTIEFYDDWELEFFPFCMAFRNALPTSACVIRRTTLDKAGLFDESRELQFAEDYEMWLRLLSLDERFLLLSEPSAFYRKHPAGVTSDRSRSRRFHQALAAKRMPYIFSLQKVALENLIYRFRTLSQQVHSQNVEIQRQQGRIQILEETNQRTRAYFPIRTLLLLRRWMAARLSGKLSQGKKKAAEIKLT